MASASSELEAAIAALPAKKQRLRECFDRLLAASPIPIPFTWADVDAHISSLQSSIAARFRQLQSHQAAALRTTADPVEHQHQHRLVRGKDQESSEEEDVGRPNRAPLDLNAGEEGSQGSAEMAIEGSPDQYDAAEEGEASPGLEPEEEGEASPDLEPEEEEEASPDLEPEEEEDASPDLEPEEEEENAEETILGAYTSHRHGETREKAPSSCRTPDAAGGVGEAVRWNLAAARADRDASLLADMLYWGNKRSLRARRQFLPALLCAAEPHALVVGAVRDFLARTEPKTDKNWENCASLLCCVPSLTAEPSAATLGRASRLAEDWREMIVGKPETFRDLGRLAVWGLLQFLVSYKITLELDADGINHLLADVPRNKKQSCIELRNGLGMIHTMAAGPVDHLIENGQPVDAIDRLIENGKLLDAVKLARDSNLTDKYPPLSLMNEYVDKAKKTAEEILSREVDSPDSLNQAMAKQVSALILSWRAVDEHVDVAHRTGIKAEITKLLHGYARKRQSLSAAAASSSSSPPAWSPRRRQEPPPREEEEDGQRQKKKRKWKPHCGQMVREARQHRFHEQPGFLSCGGGARPGYDAGGLRDRRGQGLPGSVEGLEEALVARIS